MVDRKLENNSPEKNLESMDDRSKTQEELIAELTQLRNEVASLKGSSPLSTKIIPPPTETILKIGLAEFSQSYTLMLVDDDELFRTGFRRYLTNKPHKNCQVVEFSNAEDALVWCRDHIPDIALIDYLLPEMNGLAFVTALRQQGLHEQIPCIMMTSYQDEALLVEAIKSGVKDFLDKARITPEGLNRAIANVLQKKLLIRQQKLQREQQHLIKMIAYHFVDNSSELEQVFQYTVDELRRLLQCDRVVLYQFQPDGRGEIIIESVFDSSFSLKEKEFQDNCLTQDQKWKERYLQGNINSIEDILVNSHHSSCYQEFLQQIQVRAKLSVPILQDGHLWGLLIAHQCNNPKSWLKDETELLNQIAIQLSLTIHSFSLNQQAKKEREERQKIEKIINDISTALVNKIGEDFLQALVNYLSQFLGVDCVCLTEIISLEKAKTLVVNYQQKIIDNFEIDITLEPCTEILKAEPNTVIFCPNNAQQLFAENELIQSDSIEAFLGIPLFNTSQEAIGLLTVLHHYPIENLQLAEEVLKIVSSRAGAELERQKIEAKLRESQADLLEAQQIAHLGHWTWDKLTDEIFWSEEIYHIFNIPPTQKITFPYFVNHIHPDDRENLLQKIAEAFEGKEYSEIYRIYRPDRTIRFIKTNGKAIFDAQKNPTGLKGTNLDITDLKQAEIELQALNITLEERVKERTQELTSVYLRLQNELKERQQMEIEKQKSEEFYSEYLEMELIERQRIERALSESEIRYRRIVETASEGIWQLDEENKTVFVNPKMAEILGYSVEEMIEKSILDFLLETDKTALDYLLKQREYSLIHSYDIQFCRRDGSILWAMISSRPIIDDSGEYLGCLKMVTDISDRKQNEAILKEFNRRWLSVLDKIQMIVVQLDQQGVVQYINPFFLKTYQFDLEEVIGQNWLDKFIPARLRPTIDKVFEEVIYHELHSYSENPILIKPNEERIIGWRTCSLKDDLGEVSGIIAIGEDITERYYLEQMKSEFVSIVSHELKTPLTAIQASLSLLDGKFIDPSSKEGEETISIATEGVDRLARLVDDILDLERLRLGKLTMLKTICNTQKIIESAIAQIQELAKQTNTKIEVFGESFSCYADSDRLVQVLTNLIINAIKFSPHQSTIELSIKQKDPDSSHEIDAKPYLLFAVRDRGRGIPAKNLESIFERFQQIDASDSREKGGTGLGLSICQDIVEQHDGKIWAESLLEEGSTFFFTIPIQSTEIMSNDI